MGITLHLLICEEWELFYPRQAVTRSFTNCFNAAVVFFALYRNGGRIGYCLVFLPPYAGFIDLEALASLHFSRVVYHPPLPPHGSNNGTGPDYRIEPQGPPNGFTGESVVLPLTWKKKEKENIPRKFCFAPSCRGGTH